MIQWILNYVEPSWKQLHSRRGRVRTLSRSCSRIQSWRDHEDQRRKELEYSPHTEPGIAIYSPHCANRPKQRRLVGYLGCSRYPISWCARWLAQSGLIFRIVRGFAQMSQPPAGGEGDRTVRGRKRDDAGAPGNIDWGASSLSYCLQCRRSPTTRNDSFAAVSGHHATRDSLAV